MADSMTQKIPIIGIGDSGLAGLTAAALELVQKAELLIGDEPLLALVSDHPAERHQVGDDLDETVATVDAAGDRRVVVLASGDPLFYGVARYLCDRLGKDRFEVLPHVSSMQMAFARVKESWEEAYLTDLANRPLAGVVEKIRTAEKVGLFTTNECTPSKVAAALLERQVDYFSVYVCENLGSPDERVTQGELEEISGQNFSSLNVMILVRKPDVPDRPAEKQGQRVFGNPDDAFLQAKPKQGLLTPAEVRSLALAEMDLGPGSIVWDIGAGCGAVAIEAAQLATAGTTYAVEMDAEDHLLILANTEKFGVANLVAIHGRAPDAWADLPDPDAIFLGGSGREISQLIEQAVGRLRTGGRLVANVGSIENLSRVNQLLQQTCGEVQVWLINLARGTHQLERIRFDALNPTFLIAAVKGK